VQGFILPGPPAPTEPQVGDGLEARADIPGEVD
jgi:hypothetical protein